MEYLLEIWLSSLGRTSALGDYILLSIKVFLQRKKAFLPWIRCLSVNKNMGICLFSREKSYPPEKNFSLIYIKVLCFLKVVEWFRVFFFYFYKKPHILKKKNSS